MWYKKDDESKIPEKLRKMSSEDIIKAIESGESTASEVVKLQQALAAKEASENAAKDELTKTKERLTALEANANKGKKQDDGGQPAPIQFVDDPEGFVRQQIAGAFTPVAMATLQTNAQLARSSALASLGRLKVQGTRISKGAIFDKYSSEIDALAKTTNIQSLQTPDAWIYLFNSVLGTHMEEILAAYTGGKGDEFFVEGAASSVQTNHDNPPADKPSPEEVQIAQRMKIPIEQYMKNKKEMIPA